MSRKIYQYSWLQQYATSACPLPSLPRLLRPASLLYHPLPLVALSMEVVLIPRRHAVRAWSLETSRVESYRYTVGRSCGDPQSFTARNVQVLPSTRHRCVTICTCFLVSSISFALCNVRPNGQRRVESTAIAVHVYESDQKAKVMEEYATPLVFLCFRPKAMPEYVSVYFRTYSLLYRLAW